MGGEAPCRGRSPRSRLTRVRPEKTMDERIMPPPEPLVGGFWKNQVSRKEIFATDWLDAPGHGGGQSHLLVC